MSSAITLTTWVLENYPYRDGITHLKLQKLLFYCYGIALAHDETDSLGELILFQPWEHGPVNREIWQQYRTFQASAIPVREGRSVAYSPEAESLLRDTLIIYGLLDAWSLRQQSHLERPWAEAYQQRSALIPTESIREHFQKKFRRGPVQAPEYLLDTGTLRLDNIPVQGYSSFAALAQVLKNAFQNKARLLQSG